MSQESKPRKKRVRRSAEMIVQLVLEAERGAKAAEICRREGISPYLFARWRQRAKEAMIEGLTQMKRRNKKGDPEMNIMKGEIGRLKAALCESTIELQLLKKNVKLGLSGQLTGKHLSRQIRNNC